MTDGYNYPPAMPWITGTLEGDPTSKVLVTQSPACREGVCAYNQGSSQYDHPGGTIPFVIVNSLTVGNGAFWGLSEEIRAGDPSASETIPLRKTGGFIVDPNASYPLDATIAQWDAAPWFAQLQLQSDARSGTVVRLCWHYRLPKAIRLSCSKIDNITGQIRGIYVVDDSFGLGPRTWETR